MTKIELEEIFKIIDTEIAVSHRKLTQYVTRIDQYYIDQYYFFGKKNALNDIKEKIKLKYKHLLEAN